MRISDLVANHILRLLEQDGGCAEIQRNELAGNLGCVPSQINYVLASRFTPEQGFLVESKRGGGGYIRITRSVWIRLPPFRRRSIPSGGRWIWPVPVPFCGTW